MEKYHAFLTTIAWIYSLSVVQGLINLGKEYPRTEVYNSKTAAAISTLIMAGLAYWAITLLN